MANVLYSEYLDKTITHGNKELEEIKLSYHSMKAWLLRMYGRPDTMADLYLNNIRKVKPPAGKSDVAGSCHQVKEVYGHVITLTTLEESEGVPVVAVSEHIYRNQFLKALVAVLPKTTRAQFMQKLEDEDLHVIAGKPYIRGIIPLLKNEYRRLEIEAEIDATERSQKAVKATSVHQISANPQQSSKSESSEDEPAHARGSHSRNKRSKKKKKNSVQSAQSVNLAAAPQQQLPQFTAPPPMVVQPQYMPQYPPQVTAPQPVVPQPGYVPQFAPQAVPP
jgi:hypothetical protein